jgi:hypothetical protein
VTPLNGEAASAHATMLIDAPTTQGHGSDLAVVNGGDGGRCSMG